MNTEPIGVARPFGGDYPDPSPLRVGDDYYLTHSSFLYAPGLQIWHSTDLLHWSPSGFAVPDGDGDIWAPDLIRHNERFFLYYKTSDGNKVVTADSLPGNWRSPVNLGFPRYIDPGHIAGPDGTRYLHFSGGTAAPLTPDGLALTGEPTPVFAPWEMPRDWAVEGVALEGSKLLFRHGYYHLLVAQGGTAGPATSHMVIHARARHPLGPWEYSPHNPVVHTANRAERWWSQGHGTAVEGPDGQWWLFFHAYERGWHTLGRQTLRQRCGWTPDGWLRLTPGSEPERLRLVPGLTLDDDFADKRGWQWRFYGGAPDPDRHHIGAGSLTLSAQGTVPNDSAPLTMILPGDHAFTAGVDIEPLSPDSEAGIALYYSPECAVGLGLANGAGIRTWRTRREAPAFRLATDRPVRLTLRFEEHEAAFDAVDAETGEPMTERPMFVETSGFHHNVFGGFLSLRIALYVCGRGAARFARFRYAPLPSSD